MAKKFMAAVLICFLGNHAGAQADLTMAINGKPNTVLMLCRECSPNGRVWTTFANFPLFFNRLVLGYYGLVLTLALREIFYT